MYIIQFIYIYISGRTGTQLLYTERIRNIEMNCMTRFLQKRFNFYKEGLAAEAVHVWASPNSINRRNRIQLAVPWQLITNE